MGRVGSCHAEVYVNVAPAVLVVRHSHAIEPGGLGQLREFGCPSGRHLGRVGYLYAGKIGCQGVIAPQGDVAQTYHGALGATNITSNLLERVHHRLGGKMVQVNPTGARLGQVVTYATALVAQKVRAGTTGFTWRNQSE